MQTTIDILSVRAPGDKIAAGREGRDGKSVAKWYSSPCDECSISDTVDNFTRLVEGGAFGREQVAAVLEVSFCLNGSSSMRGIGDPRAISVLARLPERGLRGCAILIPSHAQRNSYSGAAGRGDGRGLGVSKAGENAVPRDGDEQRQGNGLQQEELNRWIERWKRGARPESESVVGRPQQQAMPAGVGRGRGRVFSPRVDVARDDDGDRSGASPESQGRGRLSLASPRPARGRGEGIFTSPLGTSLFPPSRQDDVEVTTPGDRSVDGSKEDDSSIESGGKFSDQETGEEGRSVNGPSNDEDVSRPEQSAVEKLLAKLGQIPSETSPSPESNSKPKLSFQMRVVTQQPPVKPPSMPQIPAQGTIFAVPIGRGRGQPGAAPLPGIGVPPREEAPPRDDRLTEPPRDSSSLHDRVAVQSERSTQGWQSRRRTERRPRSGARESPRPPSPPRMPVEEARARAIAILEQGIEKNMAAEGERRRAGMEKFADASEFFSDRIKRTGGPSPTTSTSRTERQRQVGLSRRGDPSRRRRQVPEELALPEAVQAQLTPEQEAELLRIQNEEIFKDRLHTLFLTQFEPEFAMEEFGRNPDIDDPPIMSLEEYLQSHKAFFVKEDSELSEHQKWEEAVKVSLANAPNLEKLVEAYAGRGRMTARQQIEKLRTVCDKLPPTVPPEVAAFTQRAFITLQNNPGLNMRQKERLMTNIVSGFSSS